MFESCRNAPNFLRHSRRLLMFVGLVVGLAACSSNLIYKPEVVQGNFVSREQVQALRAGMPRQAVRDVLGTPLVTSLFHSDRWDYAFTIRRQGSEPQQRRFSVFFKGDALDRIEGDPLPNSLPSSIPDVLQPSCLSSKLRKQTWQNFQLNRLLLPWQTSPPHPLVQFLIRRSKRLVNY
jgi:outer membrane protein assembly factor BamE (lipoprotein component of BamABCDE complex)